MAFVENDFFDFEKIAETFIKDNPDKLKSKIWDIFNIFGMDEFRNKYSSILDNIERNLGNEDKTCRFIMDYYKNM